MRLKFISFLPSCIPLMKCGISRRCRTWGTRMKKKMSCYYLTTCSLFEIIQIYWKMVKISQKIVNATLDVQICTGLRTSFVICAPVAVWFDLTKIWLLETEMWETGKNLASSSRQVNVSVSTPECLHVALQSAMSDSCSTSGVVHCVHECHLWLTYSLLES